MAISRRPVTRRCGLRPSSHRITEPHAADHRSLSHRPIHSSWTCAACCLCVHFRARLLTTRLADVTRPWRLFLLRFFFSLSLSLSVCALSSLTLLLALSPFLPHLSIHPSFFFYLHSLTRPIHPTHPHQPPLSAASPLSSCPSSLSQFLVRVAQSFPRLCPSIHPSHKPLSTDLPKGPPRPSGHPMSSNVKTAPPETTQVGDYIVEYEIGRGSFATVYKGFHKVIDREHMLRLHR